ncbi:MAG: (2Fe-2S)-binding protein [Porticoccaceae bacterium]|nr:MAG: (2Fe-2S)-binding protein [Porticoccaceae bacterium]
MSKEHVTLVVNGQTYKKDVDSRMLLSDFLRETLGLTGTHVGCEHGVCGSCTVLINGKSARTCLSFAVQCDGFEITTVEGLGTVNEMHPVQQAFWEKHGLQCGFCTPGMMIAAVDLLNENPNPDREDIVEAVSGNLCRCTGYQTIIESVERAAELMRNSERG